MNFESYIEENDALQTLSERLKILIDRRETKFFTLALSGGSTAKKIFSYWAAHYSKKITWRSVKFFWVDERCVAPESDESNFKHAFDLLFKPLGIDKKNIFRIVGENEPNEEAKRYAKLSNKATHSDPIPDFDCTILGMGADGHTASIFPGTMGLMHSDSAYAVSRHPQSGQVRITMTGTSILNSHEIFLPILGDEKKHVLEKAVTEAKSGRIKLPISHIMRNSENLTLFTDSLRMQISG